MVKILKVTKKEIKNLFETKTKKDEKDIERYLKTLRPYGSTTECILKILTSNRFRKGSLNKVDFKYYRHSIFQLIRRRVRKNEPLQITLLACPFKVPNPRKVLSRVTPDLAEIGMLIKLNELNSVIKHIYPPGVEITIIHDGLFYNKPFNVTRDKVLLYRKLFQSWIKYLDLDFATSLDLIDLFGEAYPKFDLNKAKLKAKKHLKKWMYEEEYKQERHECFKLTLNEMWLPKYSREDFIKSIEEYENFGFIKDKEIERQVWNSVFIYKQNEIVLYHNDPRPILFPQAIHASAKYRVGRLSLWLIRSGHAILPWHGVGILRKDGIISVGYEPYLRKSDSFQPVYLEREETQFFYKEI